MNLNKNVVAAVLAAGSTLCSLAQAGYVVSYGHDENGSNTLPLATYDAALYARDAFFESGMPAVQNFEGFAAGTSGSLDITFGSGDSRVTATLGGTSGRIGSVEPGRSEAGRYSVDGVPGDPASEGTKFWETRATNAGSTFELWFDVPVVKFGFFGIDVGDFDGVLELELLGRDPVTGDTRVIDIVAPGGPGSSLPVTGTRASGSVLYFGITAEGEADWFRGARFRSVIGGSRTTLSDDVFAFDSFTVVAAPRSAPSPVPAPGTLALLGTALAGLALLRRRA